MNRLLHQGSALPPVRSRKASGFTLIELMVTLAILAILLMLATPSFTEWRRNTQLVTVTNTLVNALATTRSEALKRNQPVRLNFIVSNSVVSGWRVYEDSDLDNSFDADKDEELHESGVVVPDFITVSAGNITTFTYDGSGFLRGVNNTTIRVQYMNGETVKAARHIIVSRAGRVRTCRPTTPAGTCS